MNVDPPTLSGRVITFLTGSCAGVTSRIVAVRQAENPSTGPMFWSPGRPVWKLQGATEGVFPLGPDQQPGIATFNDDGAGGVDDLAELAWPGTLNDDITASEDRYPFNGALEAIEDLNGNGLLDLGDQFVINGAPFSGTGVGFNFDSVEVLAALPNGIWLDGKGNRQLYRDAGGVFSFSSPTNINPNGIGQPFALLPNATAPTVYTGFYDDTLTWQDFLPALPNRSIREFPSHLNGPDYLPSTGDEEDGGNE